MRLRTLLPALALLALLPLAACHAPPDATTTILVVRHAERAPVEGSDPPLSEAGQARALALAEAAADAGVAAIYTTQLQRTRQTAAPLAARPGIDTQVFPVAAGGAARHARDLAAHLMAHHRGSVLLVVGHSNTVPAIVEALSGHAVAPLAEHEYSHLFVVTVPPAGPARLVRARYGAPDPAV